MARHLICPSNFFCAHTVLQLSLHIDYVSCFAFSPPLSPEAESCFSPHLRVCFSLCPLRVLTTSHVFPAFFRGVKSLYTKSFLGPSVLNYCFVYFPRCFPTQEPSLCCLHAFRIQCALKDLKAPLPQKPLQAMGYLYKGRFSPWCGLPPSRKLPEPDGLSELLLKASKPHLF